MSPRAKSAAAIGLIAVLLAVFAVNSYLAAMDKCATVDEPGHFVAAWTQIQFHDFRDDCENPPLFHRLIAWGLGPGLFSINRQSSEWRSLLVNADAQAPLASHLLYGTPGVDADGLLRGVRVRMISAAVVLGIALPWWAWKLGGPSAAICAIAFFSFDPTVIAFASQIKNDSCLSLATLLLMACVWRFGQRVGLLQLFFIALLAGCAIMTKFSGFVALPAIALALLIRSLIPIAWPARWFTASIFLHRLILSAGAFAFVLVFVWCFIWASYDFQFPPSRDSADQYDFSAPIQSLANHEAFAQSDDPFKLTPADLAAFRANWRPPMSVKLILQANAHHFLPQSCLIGLLRVAAVSQSRVTFLMGKSSVTGWWYYFPLAFVFKTPVATLLALLAAAVVLIPRLRNLHAAGWWNVCALLIFPVVYLAVAMNSNTNVGVRHILPVYPFLYILLGVAGSIAWRSAKRPVRLIPVALFIGLTAESAAAFPNYLPFFNAFCGGWRGGFHLLSESNLDWGQDLPALARWQSRHPDRPICLLYWGSVPPGYYGIRYVNLPESTAPPDLPMPRPGRPVYAISAVVLTNPFTRMRERELFDYLDRHSPIEIINGSIYIYDAP
jgi:hypothetical protein